MSEDTQKEQVNSDNADTTATDASQDDNKVVEKTDVVDKTPADQESESTDKKEAVSNEEADDSVVPEGYEVTEDEAEEAQKEAEEVAKQKSAEADEPEVVSPEEASEKANDSVDENVTESDELEIVTADQETSDASSIETDEKTEEEPESKIPEFRAGDTVRVLYKIIEGNKVRTQPYEGIVIAKKGSGVSKTFTVRRIGVHGVGVERIFPLHSPNIESLTVVKRGKVRKSKLYYLRDKKGRAAMRVRERAAKPAKKAKK